MRNVIETHYMLDLETLGTAPHSVILEIGCVRFMERLDDGTYWALDTIAAENQFQRAPSVVQQVIDGFIIEQGTVDWWKRTNTPLYNTYLQNSGDPQLEAQNIRLFFRGGATPIVWARSPSFDCALLKAYCRNYLGNDISLWHFANERDHRTALDMGGVRVRKTPTHNALSDCYDQIDSLFEAFKNLNIKVVPHG